MGAKITTQGSAALLLSLSLGLAAVILARAASLNAATIRTNSFFTARSGLGPVVTRHSH